MTNITVFSIIAKQISKIMGGSVKMIEYPKNKKIIEIGDAIISNKKIKEKLNWQPKFKLNEGLEITKKFFKDNLQFYIK